MSRLLLALVLLSGACADGEDPAESPCTTEDRGDALSVGDRFGDFELTALDPAPVSMIETVITYKPEYRTLDDGTRERQWRDHIRTPDDIWAEITQKAEVPGLTSAPVLMPINARIVMLQSGMRAPMGIKVKGPDLATIEAFGLELEHVLKEVPGVKKEAVIADRIVGKPYLEVEIDRKAIARYGIPLNKVQDVIEVAIGGKPATMTVEGRERYPIRIRYPRELRDDPEELKNILKVIFK